MRNVFYTLLVCGSLLSILSVSAQTRAESTSTFKDIKLSLMKGNLLTATEAVTDNPPLVSFGVAIGNDGTQTRVLADDTSANIVLKDFKFHDNDHGFTPGTILVPVPGAVKISIGACNYGKDVTVKDKAGNVVATIASNSLKSCYHNNGNIAVEGYYRGGATTLQITGGGYIPYIGIETVNETPSEYSVTYQWGEYTNAGTLPANAKVEAGTDYTLPTNHTLYVDGKTLAAWTDGSKSYQPGEKVSITSDITLTPVFTSNSVSLADRQDEVTITWDFQRQNGAPILAYEGKPGIYVTQAVINGQTIDVKIDFNTSPGKISNSNNVDWAQMNKGTTFTLPAAKKCIIVAEVYNTLSSTTIAGATDYLSATASDGKAKTATYVYGGTDSTIDIVIGDDGKYFRYFAITYPKIVSPIQERTIYTASFTNWDAVSSTAEPVSVSKTTLFSNETLTFTFNGVTVSPNGTNTKFPNLTGWAMAEKSASGIITTSKLKNITKVRYLHGATGNSRGFKLEKKSATDTDWVVLSDAFASNPTWVECAINEKDVELRWTNLNAAQNAYLFDAEIYANVEITAPQVTLQTKVSPEGAGTISVSPSSEQYDEDAEVTLTVQKNFGYKFIRWSDEQGTTLSTENPYVHKLHQDLIATAVFEKIATYSLTTAVEGGANDYMIKATPTATVIEDENRYEEGTNVTLTANENPIMTFTHWKTGETSKELKIAMDADKKLTAVYSTIDYIVGWDFDRKGGSGRAADFVSTTENEAATLILRNAEGTTQAWLDKSTEAAGGYEGEPAAVNWKNLKEKYYYETKIKAKDFKEIKVSSKMLLNYNAYTVQKLEYSFDGISYQEAARTTLTAAKVWTPLEATLPKECDHAEYLYLRWIPDYTSALGGTASENDGTAISAIYITATKDEVNDGVAPRLTSAIPANKATGISATGRVVLTFDKKVKLTDNATATIGDKSITPTVAGKVVTFPYMGLNYNTEYTFSLPANTVSDQFGNKMANAIQIKFTTMNHPVVTPGEFDAIVSNADQLLDALAKGNAASTTGKRFRIFLQEGTYDLGARCLTDVKSNLSLIGEDMDRTFIVNKAPIEGIGVSATLQPTGENIYMQDITIKNAYDYANTDGRAVCLQDKGNKTVYKNVRLLSYQDTYYSNNSSMRSYFEDCDIHGVVDFICGGGDVFFNRTLLSLEDRAGNCITAPSTSTEWGYVFNDCIIDGPSSNQGSYALGRPWQNAPMSVWINTTMKVLPKAEGWSDMSKTNLPKLFAEYNSHTANNEAVDCSKRKTVFTPGTVPYNPVLTAEEASRFTIENVLGGTDSWQPALLTEQASAPVVRKEASKMCWDTSNYVFCYAICRNGKVTEFTKESSYTLPTDATATDLFSIRAANEMGGLGIASNSISGGATGLEQNAVIKEVVERQYYSVSGIRLNSSQKGLNIVRIRYNDGSIAIVKEFID